MKWIPVVVLAIIGVLAAIVAIEYFVVPIHSLPSFIPGHKPGGGHYHKRGAGAALVALLAFAGAAILAVRATRKPATAAPTVDDMLSADSTPQAPPGQ
jgi:hypothetical protein